MSTTEGTPAPDLCEQVRDRAALALLLGTSEKLLNFLLYRLSPAGRYREFEIKKRAGGTRLIRAPVRPLKLVQARVAELLGAHYKPRSCVFGYVKERNIQQNAERHVDKAWVLRVDLKDFFPSINFGRVRGILLAKPFSLSRTVATTLAQLCCHENQLPQGSPASPIISNIICRGLDLALSKLARAHGCNYTRYCDDLVFSGNHRTFPRSLAHFDSDTQGTTILGSALEHEIERAGFVVNRAKVQLCPSSRRQMVTGLITNVRVNVPRKFFGDVRMMLHVLRKFGPDAATEWYRSKHDKRNRPPGKNPPSFQQILRGKLQYVGSVRGWSDPAYVSLATRYAALDSTFKLALPATSRPLPPLTLHVAVEGRTDKRHIETALEYFQGVGRFNDLHLRIDGKDRGWSDLLKFCKNLAERRQDPPCVFIFDSDEADVIPQVTDGDRDTRYWENGVYSLVIAPPAHRPGTERLCIELLYTDSDLQRCDEAERRLFLTSEFDRVSGHHLQSLTLTRRPFRRLRSWSRRMSLVIRRSHCGCRKRGSPN